ncbi:RHS repeat-associated core domain-containing protein [Flammeovirgaceae bacterium SG7u.111]|nr:RHS repeat-associated core domain-containing protein [Flammeovirgaceae bacterium SG7u.132]WPO38728.1 RHS repeat-associated core domain-containing protein [Flammeovirgaceae bacterium SG7u.111]
MEIVSTPCYSYDKLNRLTAANYGFDQNFNSDEDYDVSNISYDLNGNILSLNRKGLTQQEQKSYGYIDQLSYSYDGNRLLSVADGTSGNNHEVAGDFTDGNTSGNDYAYDANGNLVKDLNKGIKDGSGNGITYNHLNLPSVIKFGSSDKRIEYTYDAAGIKLQKKVFEGGALKKTTDYVGEFVYEDGELQFMHMAEGRVLPKSTLPFEEGSGYVYEYHYKDHLGNLRVSFREATKEYVATMEETPAKTKELEEATFDQLGTRDGEFSHGGTKAVKIESTVGPYKMFKISKDDKVEASVWVYYDNPASSPSSGNYSTFFSESFGTGSETGSFFGNLGLGMKPPGTDGLNGVPLAYVQVVFYNENDEVVQSARTEIRSEDSDKKWIELKASPDKAKHNGYAKVFVVNESSEPVWVDDFKIAHQQLVVQENHYYPYGMNMAGIERQGAPDHIFQYNGKEKQEEFGLHWMDYGWRNYDATLGRWHVVDPLGHKASNLSPYRYAFNNPISFIDPNGLFETRKEARIYRREHEEVSGRISKNKDGSFSIDNSNDGTSIWNDAEFGISIGALVQAEATGNGGSFGGSGGGYYPGMGLVTIGKAIRGFIGDIVENPPAVVIQGNNPGPEPNLPKQRGNGPLTYIDYSDVSLLQDLSGMPDPLRPSLPAVSPNVG